MRPKQIYNLDSNESFKEAKIINGNPSGIINFTDTNLKWATSLWDVMMSYTWFPAEANMSLDANAYKTLTDAEKRAYDLCLAQLITNDSIQTNQLMDNINRYVSAPLANALLARQAFEEALHSKSYAVMVEELGTDPDRIYNMHKHDKALERKNNAVANMYKSLTAENPTDDDMLLAFAANIILELLVFPGGFLTLWSMGSKMTATKTMIAFIERDESGTHVPLFSNLYKTAYKQTYGYTRSEHFDKQLADMIITMTNEEKIWTKYLTQGLLGFSEKAIDMFIENKANQVFNKVGIPKYFEVDNGGPLSSIESKCSMLGGNKKTNFFEATVGDYSMGTLTMNF